MDDSNNLDPQQPAAPLQVPVSEVVEIQPVGFYKKPAVLISVIIIGILVISGGFLYANNKGRVGTLQSTDNAIRQEDTVVTKTENSFNANLFIEENFGDRKYSRREDSDYCGDIVKIPSLSCVTHQASYAKIYGDDDGISVDISVHENIDRDAGAIVEDVFIKAQKKVQLKTLYIDGNKIYKADTYFGSYYYWLHGNKEILVSAAMMCAPDFIKEIEKERSFEGRALTDENIKNMKDQCTDFEQIAKKYSKKYSLDGDMKTVVFVPPQISPAPTPVKGASPIKEFISLDLNVEEIEKNKDFQSMLDASAFKRLQIGLDQSTNISLGGTDVALRITEAVEDSSDEKILCTSDKSFCQKAHGYISADIGGSIMKMRREEIFQLTLNNGEKFLVIVMDVESAPWSSDLLIVGYK